MLWPSKLAGILTANGFLKCAYEPGLRVRTIEKSVAIIVVYVNDVLDALPTIEDRVTVSDMLGEQLVITDLGEHCEIIAWQFAVVDNKILIHQANFQDKSLRDYKMIALKATRSPITSGTLLYKTSSDETLAEKNGYRLKLNTLQYLSTGVQPDICFIVNVLSCFVRKPSKPHDIALNTVIAYHQSTKFLGLEYKRRSGSNGQNEVFEVKTYSGLYFGERSINTALLSSAQKVHAKSTTGYAIVVNKSVIAF
jgi:hypothetical protein